MHQAHKLMQNNNIQIYYVGGCVRDVLMGRTPKDYDFVVTGATPQDMVQAGFSQVGSNFPVFLSETGEEYALARQERKTGVGYNGFETTFDPTVTIQDDLERRDLTINSMAVKQEDWEEFVQTKNRKLVVDPFGGMLYISLGVLRHTSDAFAEDPIRVLRTARFAARYNFVVDIVTERLMQQVVQELNHVPHERIWMEFEKGLCEPYAHRMISIMQDVGAFDVDIMKPYSHADATILERIRDYQGLDIWFAAISKGFTDADYETCRIPTEYVRISKAINKHGMDIAQFHHMPAKDRLEVIMQMRALSNEDFAINVFHAAHILFNGDTHSIENVIALMRDIATIKSIDTAAIIDDCKNGQEIKARLHKARLEKMIP